MQTRQVTFRSAGHTLAGSVWSPDEPVRASAVALIGGSGPTDRTNAGYFDLLRNTLVASGVVVLGYDKRGSHGLAGGWASASPDLLAADAAEAVRVLAHQPGVDRTRVGLLGHSEGGWVALRACSLQRCAFLVLNSCPAVSFMDAEIYAMARAGVDASRARTLYEELRSAALAGADITTANRLLNGSDDPQLRLVLEDAGFTLDQDRWTQLRSWIDHDPDVDLRRLAAPTLAVYGADDPLTPVQASLAALEQRAPGVEVRLFAGADHRVHVGGRPAPDYLDTIVTWCSAPAA